jgi:hypothetical protein
MNLDRHHMQTEKPVERSLNLGTLFFSLLAVVLTFVSLFCIDENKYQEGSYIGALACVFLLLALWNQRHPFYPLVFGLLYYLTSIITLSYFFPKIIIEGTGFWSPYIYLLLGFLFNLYLLPKGYKKWKSQTALLPSRIQKEVLQETI